MIQQQLQLKAVVFTTFGLMHDLVICIKKLEKLAMLLTGFIYIHHKEVGNMNPL